MRYEASEIFHMAHWASQECEWQGSGERSVGKLVSAVLHTIEDFYARGLPISERVILLIGAEVDPRNNVGYRQQPVWVGRDEMLAWGKIPGQVADWVTHHELMSPTEAFKTFEEIHPFIDGNGHTGAILYNWLNGTLAPGELVFPPNVFGDPRR